MFGYSMLATDRLLLMDFNEEPLSS